jgi:hypothetical protein
VEANSRAADLVIAACAISAGAHAALVPSHMDHEPQLGVAFVVAVALLLGAGVAIVHSPSSPRAARAAALLFAALIAAYAAATTVGIPLLSVQPETVDGVALVTKLVESLGLLLALKLSQPVGGHRSLTRQEVSQ